MCNTHSGYTRIHINALRTGSGWFWCTDAPFGARGGKKRAVSLSDVTLLNKVGQGQKPYSSMLAVGAEMNKTCLRM